jgi:hypothetical protein
MTEVKREESDVNDDSDHDYQWGAYRVGRKGQRQMTDVKTEPLSPAAAAAAAAAASLAAPKSTAISGAAGRGGGCDDGTAAAGGGSSAVLQWAAAAGQWSGGTLVVCPPSILQQWVSEAARHSPQLKLVVYDGLKWQRAQADAESRKKMSRWG